MRKIILCLAVILLLFAACEKDTVWVYYDETIGNDKWASTPTHRNTTKNLKKYLRSKQIQFYKVEYTSDGIVDPCRCSNCRTGTRVHCKIDESDLSKALEENFYQ